jgi:hypothetical protein
MSFRDDHDAALLRADAAERERGIVVAENERLQAELAEARQWLGAPAKRGYLAAGLAIGGATLLLIGVWIGRATISPAAPVRVKAPRLPTVTGVIVSDGPRVGHWTMSATRCTPRGDGVELTTIGDSGVSIWLGNDQVELETRAGTLFLERKRCLSKLVAQLARQTDGSIDGRIELDCQFEGNWLQGRIDFQSCR